MFFDHLNSSGEQTLNRGVCAFKPILAMITGGNNGVKVMIRNQVSVVNKSTEPT